MINIDYKAVGFTPSWAGRVSSRGQVTVRFIDVIAAAMSVGRPGWSSVLSYGIYSRAEMLYRALQVIANLAPISGQLKRSAAYDGLDASEKSAISYFFGLTLAKLMADELFSVPFLTHIGSYSGLSFRFASGSSRPDLVGLDARGQWYVVEAKGRSNIAEANLLSKAKVQTRMVRQIAGQFPCLRLAVVTEFLGGALRVQLADPEGNEDDAEDLLITAVDTLRIYYASWFDLINAHQHKEVVIGDRRFAVVHIPELDLAAGMDFHCAKYLENIQKGSTAETAKLQELLNRLPRGSIYTRELQYPGFEASAVRIGKDGLILALGRAWKKHVG